jgi:hypothetical protein
MNTDDTGRVMVQISAEKLLALVRSTLGRSGGYPDDEHPSPPGPWDPVIRGALETRSVFGPHPEPWDGNLRRFSSRMRGSFFGDEVALNPQPLPPRYAFLSSVVQAVVSLAELLQEVGDAIRSEGEERGIIIVSGYIDRFVDDFCGNGFRMKYPFPGPRPRWFSDELDGLDLVVIATQFDQAAREAFSSELRQVLAYASVRLLEAGLERMVQG